MKKIKVLMIIAALDYCNGVTSYALNYYNNLDKNLFQIDFAVHYNYEVSYADGIKQNGGNVYFMGDYSIKSMLGLSKRIKKLYAENKYDIIHCHVLNVAYFYFKEAKKAGIKVRIIHSHATKNSDNFLKNIRNNIFRRKGLKYATEHFACSELAGEYLYKNSNFKVIKNCVDYSNFLFSEKARLELFKKYEIDNSEMVIGFVGRFTAQKNLPFLLKIFKKLSDLEFPYRAFIVGNGEQEALIKEFIASNGLDKKVQIVDSIPNVGAYYSLFDIFLLPSIFEGLPVTGVEAQVAGCKLFLADTITKELSFTENCKFLSIDSIDKWVDNIITCKKNSDRNKFVPANDYNILYQAKYMADLYTSLLEEKIDE